MSSSSLKDGQKSLERDKDFVPNSSQIEVGKASFHDSIELDAIEHTDTGWYIWLIALTASIGGMLFGYDTGIISAVLVYIEDSLGHLLSASEKELITSLCSAGAFVGSIIAGLTADRYGCKGPMYLGCALFTVGAVLQASAYSVPQMAVGRLIVGFGVESAAMIVPAYIAEIAPTKHRGRMIGLNNVSITGGQLISYTLGAAFASVPNGWRYMVGLGGIPSILLAILLPLCPESPRQLIYHDKREEARTVLHRIFRSATLEQVQDKINLIEAGVRESQASIGNTAWMSADFFPMEVRAVGTMYMTCCCWGSNLIVSSTFLSMMKGITPSGAFGFYACLTFIGWVMIIFFYPEMSGLQLEEIREVFKHGFGVRYASRLRKQRAEDSRARLS
ncbi:hypothetical protein N7527_007094 [Penicillium freii]|nr:hypothetical protein N7527_007094 [Penicillium freii]